jgi:hypothetical protein
MFGDTCNGADFVNNIQQITTRVRVPLKAARRLNHVYANYRAIPDSGAFFQRNPGMGDAAGIVR